MTEYREIGEKEDLKTYRFFGWGVMDIDERFLDIFDCTGTPVQPGDRVHHKDHYVGTERNGEMIDGIRVKIYSDPKEFKARMNELEEKIYALQHIHPTPPEFKDIALELIALQKAEIHKYSTKELRQSFSKMQDLVAAAQLFLSPEEQELN